MSPPHTCGPSPEALGTSGNLPHTAAVAVAWTSGDWLQVIVASMAVGEVAGAAVGTWLRARTGTEKH